MRKMIVLLVATVFAVTTAVAQEKKGPERQKKSPAERADSCANRMERNLGLTADQKVKVRALALTRAEKMDELREKYKGKEDQRETWRTERKQAQDAFTEGMRKTLTPEQMAKWEEQKKARAEKHKAHKGHHKGHHKGKSDSTGGHKHGKCGDGKPENKK